MGNHKIVVFKSEAQLVAADPYKEELIKCGFETQIVSVINFNYKCLEILRDKLQHPDHYSGLILTSERCVEAVTRALGSQCKDVMSSWQSLTIFCTGPATSARAETSLGVQATFGDKQRLEGIIDGLTQLIASEEKLMKPVLYPCGELAHNKDLLRAAPIRNNDMQIDTVVVYETLPNPLLQSMLADLYSKPTEDWPRILVFFSPSGLKAALEAFKSLPDAFSFLQHCQFVAIGPTTAAAVRTHGFQVWAEAAKPNPQCLSEAILAVEKNS